MISRILAALLVATVVAQVVVCNPTPSKNDEDTFFGGYILLSRARNGQVIGLSELNELAQNAATLPATRLWLAFVDPTLVYIPGSYTLETVGMNISNTGDYGFAAVKSAIQTLQASGIEVFISMGGWNYNCFPYLYMRYSVGGYGTSTPNYWKIQTYGGGDMNNCNETNQYCYVCEPPSEGTTLASFAIFPEPQASSSWQEAAAYVEAHANATNPPQWNYDLIPGHSWTDAKTGISVTVPGRNQFIQLGRNPYEDVVHLANELGADGVDLDYEEFWHADYFKVGNGPWDLPQSVYKWTAIAYNLQTSIKSINPSLKLSTAAGAVSAWSSNWWGGNLKGLMYWANKWAPDVVNFIATGPNAGGVNVMSYDLSDNPQFHECPDDMDCPLDKQVAFYMNAYVEAGIKANVGYEIGTPAYPAPDHDKEHQLPLTREMFQSIISTTQTQHSGGFIWELYKTPDSDDNVDASTCLQTICKTVMPNSPRCTGTIPPAFKAKGQHRVKANNNNNNKAQIGA